MHLVGPHVVLWLHGSLCDAQQALEDRHQAGIVWMACQEDWQVRLTNVGPIAQRLEQGTHNALVLGSNPSRPMNTIPIQ